MMNQRKLERVMRQLATKVAAMLPGKLFTVIVFDQNNPNGDYISNAQRPEMIQALRQVADRLEARQDIPAIKEREHEH